MTERLKISCGEVYFKQGILFIHMADYTEVGPEEVKELYLTGTKLAGGKPYCALAYTLNKQTSTPEARQFSATTPYAEDRLADAILVDSVWMKLAANVYINFNKPRVPTRVFTAEAKAIAWLRKKLAEKAKARVS